MRSGPAPWREADHDNDRDPHNHPMPFWSFVLAGGYAEQRYAMDQAGNKVVRPHRRRRRFSLARTRYGDFHHIFGLFERPTITLLLTGRRRSSWGFLTPEGYVDQATYRARRGEAA